MRTRRPRPAVATRSAFAGFRFPPDVIVLAVRWYLRFGLSYRQVIGVFVSARRDTMAAHRFFQRAIGTTKVAPVEVVTDRAATYPMVLEELVPAAWHRTERYANNRVEADHGRLKARLRPMRGLKQDYSAR